MLAIVTPEKCEGCGACVEICPSGAIELENEKAVIDADMCSGCGACVETCPTDAIELE